MKYVALGAGLGGLRTGLDNAGWSCVLAIDSDPEVAVFHRSVFGDCIIAAHRHLDGGDFPPHDLLAYSLPKEPFSSPTASGWSQTREPTALETCLKIVDKCSPNHILLETGYRFLRQQGGYPMSWCLDALIQRGYDAEWQVLDASWFGVPQSRPRLTIFAFQRKLYESDDSERASIAERIRSRLCNYSSGSSREFHSGLVSESVTNTFPRVGRAADGKRCVWASAGIARGDYFTSYQLNGIARGPVWSLADIARLPPEMNAGLAAVRYFARGGITKPRFRRTGFSYCVGGKVSAAPLLAVPIVSDEQHEMKEALRKVSNWIRFQDGWLIFRLTPDRAAFLFGPGSEKIANALSKSSMTAGKQYRLLGNMAAPSVIEVVAHTIEHTLAKRRCVVSAVTDS